ncbi:hypothetical protein ACIPSE_36350 [Streptomyces sp. NPDC090106]|uniref:hypothetical protein n=1 Tax=Streptomyces sp. NPDC090106 TaxID=3365946 RepID=UPI0037F5BA27
MTEQTRTETETETRTEPEAETSTEPEIETEPVVPPVPSAPPVAPAVPAVPPPLVVPAAPRNRRVLRAVLRWTTTVVVFAVAGVGTAYGVSRMERTDVPGLATESDGRWDYPELVKPPLPSGSPGPFAGSNPAGSHYADLRELLLPAPEGAKTDKALEGQDGWLSTKDLLKEYAQDDDVDALRHDFVDQGLRHVAARGWTMPDGTHTRIYLLQFGTAAVVDTLYSDRLTNYNSPQFEVRGSDGGYTRDEQFPLESELPGVVRAPYLEVKPYGKEQVRQAYLSAGDVLALVVQSRAGGAEATPFWQTVVLQGQLLR